METIFTSLPQYVVVSLIVLFAQGVYVMFGFGAGLIAVGALTLLLPTVQDVVVLLLLINIPAELFVAIKARKRIVWRPVLLICLGIGIGVPLGTWLLQTVNTSLLLIALGACLVVIGGTFLAIPQQRVVRWPRWAAPPTGLLSGTLGGLFGTEGPPLVLYYQLSGTDKAAFRGQLMAIFLVVTLVRLPCYAGAGLLTPARMYSAVAVAPAVLAGLWLGHRLQLQLQERTFKRMVSAALMVLGAALLARLAV
jgi:uncharacterized protein